MAAFEGLIHKLWATEDVVERRMGRRKFHGIPIVAGGILGTAGEIVVDNIHHPKIVYGMADGTGDFIRRTNANQDKMIHLLKKKISNV